MDRFDLSNKVAIVTGGGQGIGKAIALALAEAGANLAIVDINLETALEVSENIKQLGRSSIAIKCDVSIYEQVMKMKEDVIKKFGRIDLLVNNAGIDAPPVPLEEMPLESWNKVMNVNLTSVFICSQIVGQQFIKQKKGCIINISSMTGLIINKGIYVGPYAASKAGVILLTKALANDWAIYNIRVNNIAPGYIRSPMTKSFMEDEKLYKESIELIPMKRMGETFEIGAAAVFLASDASSYITGHTLLVDGGYTVL